jgi:FlaA1/EpsC-like NDP-sugar epimerase
MSKIFDRYHTIRLPACVGIDFLLISSTVLLSAVLRFSMHRLTSNSGFPFIRHACLTAFVCQLCMYYADLYDFRVALSSRTLLSKLGQSLGIATVILMGLFYVLPGLQIGRVIFVLSLVLAFSFLWGWRLFFQRLHASNRFSIKVLIVGTSEEAQKLASELWDQQPLGYEIIGFLGENNEIGKNLL